MNDEPSNLKAYSINQFAQVYGISHAQCYVEINAGRLATYRVGRRRFIAPAAAAAWQRAREVDERAG